MTRAQTYISATLTVLSGIAVYCFFAFKYPYHLHFQEQYQLFESTWAYFGSVAAIPGGLADWLGRFLTQFCYHAPVGAALMTLLVIAVQLLTWAVCRRHTFVSYALSFLPAIASLAFLCDENALAGGVIALILALACAALCTLVRSDKARWILEAVLVPLVYLACGGIAVVFVLVCLLREFARCGLKALPISLILLALAALCPFIAARIFPYPLGRLCYGVHYYRYHNILPGMLWVSALCSVLVAGVCSFGTRERTDRWQWIAGSVLFVLLAALGTGLVFKTADFSKEETMRYDFMARMGMWNRIMMRADGQNPQNHTALSCLNLALAKTGRMGDFQFSYYQDGTEGLLPGFVADFTSPVTTGEIFWHLGMVNTAQRFAFEAQEAIPDFQKSARCYKRLAQTNIVNGDWDVARKYLKSLHNAVFYRHWADETMAQLEAGDPFQQPDLEQARTLRLQKHDFLFSDTEMDSMLGLLKVENPSNQIALDYLMSWCLLQKNLDRFAECLSLVDTPALPKSYQEALLLRWALTHNDLDGAPSYIFPAHKQRIVLFMNDLRAGKAEDAMRKLYGDTYWFYYYYRQDSSAL